MRRVLGYDLTGLDHPSSSRRLEHPLLNQGGEIKFQVQATQKILTDDKELFILQCFCGIDQGSFDGMIAYGRERNDDSA